MGHLASTEVLLRILSTSSQLNIAGRNVHTQIKAAMLGSLANSRGWSSDWKDGSLMEVGLPYLDKGKGDQSRPEECVEGCGHCGQRHIVNGLIAELIQRDQGCMTCVPVCSDTNV